MNQAQLYPYFENGRGWPETKGQPRTPITALPVENSKDPIDFSSTTPFVTFPEANSLSKDAPKLDEARAKYSVLAEATRNPLARSS
jgi:hypothetical protein